MSGPGDLLQSRILELLPKLRRFARCLTRNPHDADDLLQGALERALTHLEQWQADTRLDSWLYTIVKHAWIDERVSLGPSGRKTMAWGRYHHDVGPATAKAAPVGRSISCQTL